MTVNSTFGAAIATVQSYLPSIAETTKYGAQVAVGYNRLIISDTIILLRTIGALHTYQATICCALDAYNATSRKCQAIFTLASIGCAAATVYNVYSLVTKFHLEGGMISQM